MKNIEALKEFINKISEIGSPLMVIVNTPEQVVDINISERKRLYDIEVDKLQELICDFFRSSGFGNEIKEIYTLLSKSTMKFKKINCCDVDYSRNNYDAYIAGMLKFINNEIDYNVMNSEASVDKVIGASNSDSGYIDSLFVYNTKETPNQSFVKNVSLSDAMGDVSSVIDIRDSIEKSKCKIGEYVQGFIDRGESDSIMAKALIYMLTKSYIKFFKMYVVQVLTTVMDVYNVISPAPITKTNLSNNPYDQYKLF